MEEPTLTQVLDLKGSSPESLETKITDLKGEGNIDNALNENYDGIDQEIHLFHRSSDIIQEKSSVNESNLRMNEEKRKDVITNSDQEISGVAAEGSVSAASPDVPNPIGAGDTSITDDEIEVICTYSSPKLDEDFIKESKMEDSDATIEPGQSGEHPFEFHDAAIVGAQLVPNHMMFIPPGPNCQHGAQNGLFHIENHPFYAASPLLPPGMQAVYPQYANGQQVNFVNQGEPIPQSTIIPFQNYQDKQVFYHPYSTLVNQPADGGYGAPPPLQPTLGHSGQETMDNPLPEMLGYEMNDPIVNPEFGAYPEVGYQEESHAFVYPSIYVSTSGMITVLLKNDISVEMTVDRTLRLVNHQLRMAVATNSRGTASVLHTPSAKVSQNNTTTDAEVNGVKAKMTSDCILFGSGTSCYKFDYNYIEPASPRFTDVSSDKSVNLLFASEGYGSTLVQQCLHLAGTAEYENLPKGGVIIRINGVKITQTGRGDVTVVSGPKFMKISPHIGYVRLNTHFTEMAVDKDGVLRMRRGNHTINSSNDRVILSNGKIEAGLDNQERLKVYTLPKRVPLEISRDQRRPRPGNPRRKATALGGAS